MQEEQLKSTSIKDYLAEQGIFPTKEHYGYGMYKSPFRDEKTPSFKVDYNKNLWYDFGSNEGGSIVDLIMKIHKCNYIQAVEFLEKDVSQNLGTYQQPTLQINADKSANTSQTITSVKPLENPKLLQFLQIRKIDVHIAQAYCKEIHYQIGGRNYFAIGFPNNMSGYELRNPQFKGCFPPKEITTFDKKTPTVHLFEGFMDYFSLLTMQAKQADVSAVVLNSIANLDKAIPFLSKHTQINTFLDNDDGGKRALDKLQNLKLPIVDYSKKYAEYKDVNDYLCGKKTAKKQAEINPKITKNRGFKR